MAEEPATTSQTGTVEALAAVRPEHTGDFLRLAQLWEKRSHFSLLLAAVGDSAYRDALIRRLDEMVPSARVDLSLDATPEVWLDQLQSVRRGGATRVHVCLPISPRRGEVWWQKANVIRERLADAFPGPHLLWLADADVDTAAHQAPDLWNWREGVFGFSPAIQSADRLTVPGQPFSTYSGIDAVALEDRLRAIDALVAEHAADDAAVAHLLLEAAQALQRLGHWVEAEINAKAAAAAFERRGDQAGAAHAMAVRADLTWRRGDPIGALEMLRQSVLPVYEKLGDQRSRAVTMGKIADVLQARGELDEALRIQREEELPVYERLGDQRSLLVCRANLAMGLLQRGNEGDEPAAAQLLQTAYAAAQRMRLPEAEQISQSYRRATGRPIDEEAVPGT